MSNLLDLSEGETLCRQYHLHEESVFWSLICQEEPGKRFIGSLENMCIEYSLLLTIVIYMRQTFQGAITSNLKLRMKSLRHSKRKSRIIKVFQLRYSARWCNLCWRQTNRVYLSDVHVLTSLLLMSSVVAGKVVAIQCCLQRVCMCIFYPLYVVPRRLSKKYTHK